MNLRLTGYLGMRCENAKLARLIEGIFELISLRHSGLNVLESRLVRPLVIGITLLQLLKGILIVELRIELKRICRIKLELRYQSWMTGMWLCMKQVPIVKMLGMEMVWECLHRS